MQKENDFHLDWGKGGKGKGKGKGFQGNCWSCGEKSNSGKQCRKYTAKDIGSVEEQREVMCGGAWSIAQVEVDDGSGWNVALRKGPKRRRGKQRRGKNKLEEQKHKSQW